MSYFADKVLSQYWDFPATLDTELEVSCPSSSPILDQFNWFTKELLMGSQQLWAQSFF